MGHAIALRFARGGHAVTLTDVDRDALERAERAIRRLAGADFPSYIETYEKVYHLYVDHKDEWIKKAIVNTAKSGYFSSDRTIEQYNEKIWNLKPVK